MSQLMHVLQLGFPLYRSNLSERSSEKMLALKLKLKDN